MRSTSRRDWQRERRDDLPLLEVLHILWGRRLTVVGTVLVLVAVGLLFGLFSEPIYTAEATINVEPREELTSAEEGEAFLEEVRSAVVSSEGFQREVMHRAGWEARSAEFTDRLDPQTFMT